ncbi:MAG TPA: ATPase domain-containing protein [archaeon]|nr:ATPase domain-containing protein [archaeon]
MERIRSGIKGFDELIEGGFPKGSTILVSGGSGTGKTIFGLSYLIAGAKLYKEPGLYISLEGNLQNIIWNIESFGWDLKPLQEANKLKIYRMNLHTQENVESQIEEEMKVIAQLVKDMGCKRLVVDSTTALGVWIAERGKIRHMLYSFAESLRELGCTTMLIAETRGRKTDYNAFGVEDYVADSVIAMYFVPPNRSIFVKKMRGTNHSATVHPFTITSDGIEVRPKDEILWEALK